MYQKVPRILGSERVPTSLHTQGCESCNTSMSRKQDGVYNDPATFSCHMCAYALVCVYNKVSEIVDQILVWSRLTPSCVVITDTPVRIQRVLRKEDLSSSVPFGDPLISRR